MAYHKIKKQIKNPVKNIMTGKITDLIDDKLQKVSTQFNEGQKQLANFSEANKNLKELMFACNKKTAALEEMVKSVVQEK